MLRLRKNGRAKRNILFKYARWSKFLGALSRSAIFFADDFKKRKAPELILIRPYGAPGRVKVWFFRIRSSFHKD